MAMPDCAHPEGACADNPLSDPHDRLALAWGALAARSGGSAAAEYKAALVSDVYRHARPETFGVSIEGRFARSLPGIMRQIASGPNGLRDALFVASEPGACRTMDCQCDAPADDVDYPPEDFGPVESSPDTGAVPVVPVDPNAPDDEWPGGPADIYEEPLDFDALDEIWRTLTARWLEMLSDSTALRHVLVHVQGGQRSLVLREFDNRIDSYEPWRGSSDKGACCPEYFNYPDVWQPIAQDKGDKRKVGVYFEARAKYDNLMGPCRCECCQFEQYILLAGAASPLQDCAWLDPTTGTWKSTVSTRVSGGKIPPSAPVLCAGDRVDSERVKPYVYEAAGTKYETPCKMTFVDPTGVTYSTDHPSHKARIFYLGIFIGVIWDVCHDMLKDMGIFEINWRSKAGDFPTGSEWEGDLTKPPLKVIRTPRYQSREPAEKEPDHSFVAPNADATRR